MQTDEHQQATQSAPPAATTVTQAIGTPTATPGVVVNVVYDAGQVTQVLGAMLLPDTNTVKQATAWLNKFLENWTSIPVLIQVYQASTSTDLRQLACVLIRKKVGKLWPDMSVEARHTLQSVMLNAIAGETAPTARKAAVEVVALVGRKVLPEKEWPELLPFLYQLIQSPNPNHRESSLKLFGLLTDIILDEGPSMKQFVLNVLTSHLSNASNGPAVRLAALMAVGSLVPFLETEEDVDQFRDMTLPHLIEVLRFCVKSHLPDYVVDAFSVLIDLIEMPLKAVKSCLPPLLRVALEVANERQFEFSCRAMAMSFVEWAARYKPILLREPELLQAALTVLYSMSSEPEDEIVETWEDESPHTFATAVFDQMSASLSTRTLYTSMMTVVPSLLASENQWQRKAAMGSLAAVTEHCSESFRENLSTVVPLVVRHLRDPSKHVRQVTFSVLREFSDFLQPEFMEYHAQVLPAICENMVNPDKYIQRTACMVLEAFTMRLGADVKPYISDLMNGLGGLLVSGPAELRDAVVAAIAAVAEAAEKDFAPYYSSVMPILQQIIQKTAEDDLLQRGRGLECISSVAKSVGPAVFKPYLPEFMQSVLQTLQMDNIFTFELKDMSFEALTDVADVMGEEFAPYLGVVMPHVFEMMESSEGVYAEADEKEKKTATDGITTDSEDDDDEDLDDDECSVGCDAAFVDAKASSCFLVGMCARATGLHFFPFLEKSINLLHHLAKYLDEAVREAVANALQFMVYSANLCFPSTEPGQLHRHTQQVVGATMNTLLKLITRDEVPQVVIQALDSVAFVSHSLGLIAIDPYFEKLTHALTRILKNRAPCIYLDEDDCAEDDVDEDRYIELKETVGEVICELCRIYEQKISPFFESVLPFFLKLMRAENHLFYRALSIGTLAEYVKFTKVDTNKILPMVAPVIIQGLSDSEKHVRRNAAFACGLILSGTGPTLTPYHTESLKLLHALLLEPPSSPARDNALGAVARILLVQSHLLPIEQIIPIFLAQLPLSADEEENEPVYSCISHLFRTAPDKMFPHLSRVLAVFGMALNTSTLQEPVRKIITDLLLALAAQCPDKMQAAITQIPQELQVSLMRHIQQAQQQSSL
ncbi:ARM repeat superfamily protein [Pelomyxa schiedti]|nr:ARM repeat superfamily protein [Pelomyxa schiedti]